MSYSPYAPPRHDAQQPYAGYGQQFVYQPLGWKTMAIVVGILATVILEMATTAISWALGGAAGDASNMGALMAAGLLGLLQSGVSLFTIVVFLVWINNAAKNVRTFGHDGLRFTPGWAVGWWFIPIASMWMPFLALREIWRASEPESVGRGPGAWMTTRVPPIFGVWWATYLLAGFVGAFAALPMLLNPGSAAGTAPAISMVSHAFNAVAAITIVVIVRSLARNQDASHEKLVAMQQQAGGGHGGGYGAPAPQNPYGAPPGYGGPPGYPPYGSST